MPTASVSRADVRCCCLMQVGDIVVGQVVQYESSGALVDIGGKSSAFLAPAEASMQRVDDLEDFMLIGDHREFQIIGGEDENGQVKLSIRRLEFARAWERVRQIQAEDCTINAEIMSINRGGALVNFEGLRGFLPGSHAPQGSNVCCLIFLLFRGGVNRISWGAFQGDLAKLAV